MSTRRQLLGVAFGTAAGATLEPAAALADGVAPRLEFVFEARVGVDKPIVVGPSSLGLRRIVPITGGTVEGPKLTGRVLPGGADWQFVRADGAIVVEAKYTLESRDGVTVMVTNRGLRHGSPEVMARLGRGEAVPAAQYYFRTTAEFEAPTGSQFEWMNRALFIGMAERQANAAVVRFYQLL